MTTITGETPQLNEHQELVLELSKTYMMPDGRLDWKRIRTERPEAAATLQYNKKDLYNLKGRHVFKWLVKNKLVTQPRTMSPTARDGSKRGRWERTAKHKAIMSAAQLSRYEQNGHAKPWRKTKEDQAGEMERQVAERLAVLLRECRFCPRCQKDLSGVFNGAAMEARLKG